MIDIRRFEDLGRFRTDWLNARYHFSFANYFDPARMGHGKLRVWNDDEIAAGSGFPPHGHQDMEIITYVRQGAITHEDSLGNQGRTLAGDVQVMSAGRGVRHSEWNAEDDETRLFQIWVEPAEIGGAPSWDARAFPKADRAGRWSVLASGDRGDEALPLRQDAKVLGATVAAGGTLDYEFATGRNGYLVLASGSATLNGEALNARDGAAMGGGDVLKLKSDAGAEIVLVDTI